MSRIAANGLALEYETFGSPGNALLLVSGLGAQMISWHEDFCALLAERGFFVIRFDNRDTGRSQWLDELGVPDPLAVMRGDAQPAYTLDAMADDAIALLDALEISTAHLLGASMGGFIAQLIAIRRPERARSLVSIMSGPGGVQGNVPGTAEAQQALIDPPPPGREEMIEHSVAVGRALGGSLFDEDERRILAGRAIERGITVAGTMRQLGAIAAAPTRLEALRQLRLPALVIHGEADPLLPLENGQLTASAIPGATLLSLPGMGHDLPRAFWPHVVQAVAENAARG
jgi:pimeloyl-ACP methyl ester carboxylesterase